MAEHVLGSKSFHADSSVAKSQESAGMSNSMSIAASKFFSVPPTVKLFETTKALANSSPVNNYIFG